MFKKEILLLEEIKESVKQINTLEYSKVINVAEEKIINYFRENEMETKTYSYLSFSILNNFQERDIRIIKEIDKIISRITFIYLEYGKNMDRAIEVYNENKKENYTLYDALIPYLA